MAAGSGVRNIVSAAAIRTVGSSDPKVSVPSRSRIVRRRLLLTRTLVTAAFGSSPASAPVSGSASLTACPASAPMKTALSDLRK